MPRHPLPEGVTCQRMIGVHVRTAEFEAVYRVAEVCGTSASALCRQALSEWVQAHTGRTLEEWEREAATRPPTGDKV